MAEKILDLIPCPNGPHYHYRGNKKFCMTKLDPRDKNGKKWWIK